MACTARRGKAVRSDNAGPFSHGTRGDHRSHATKPQSWPWFWILTGVQVVAWMDIFLKLTEVSI